MSGLKSRAEHEKAHAKLVQARSPLADTYYAVHLADTRKLSAYHQPPDPKGDPRAPGTLSTKPAGNRTAYEEYQHRLATNDPSASVYGAIHAKAINASRPAEGDIGTAGEAPHAVHLDPPNVDDKEPLP